MKKEKQNPFNEEVVQEQEKGQENMEEAVQEADAEETVVSDDMDALQKKLDELNAQYIRMAADFDNYRKRQAQERESLLKYGAEKTLKELLVVLDNFERAKDALKDVDDVKQVKDSFDVVQKQLVDTLEKSGLKAIDTNGQKFDPNLHEAVMQTPSDDVENETILQELQKGYMLEDRILRAALVNVAVNDK